MLAFLRFRKQEGSITRRKITLQRPSKGSNNQTNWSNLSS